MSLLEGGVQGIDGVIHDAVQHIDSTIHTAVQVIDHLPQTIHQLTSEVAAEGKDLFSFTHQGEQRFTQKVTEQSNSLANVMEQPGLQVAADANAMSGSINLSGRQLSDKNYFGAGYTFTNGLVAGPLARDEALMLGSLAAPDDAPLFDLSALRREPLEPLDEGLSGSPSQLVAGQAAEAEQLAALNSSGKVPFPPTPDQVNSAAFQVIVGKPKYTAAGDLVGTIYDGLTSDGLAELKNGSSVLDSSYQLRLQTYGALVNNTPLTIYTNRAINPTFQDYLTRWGVSVAPLPPP